MHKTFLTIALLSLPVALNAQLLVESGDAGDLPGTAQVATGAGPLTDIVGRLTTGADVDMYVIRISNPSTFDANTCVASGAFSDTQLSLFALDGTGISFNDDDPTPCTAASSLRSRVTGQFLPGPGCYLLAIASFDNPAQNASSDDIWALTPFGVERQPDGPGAGNPVLAGWGGPGGGDGLYQIVLTGADFFGAGSGTFGSWSPSNCQGGTSLALSGNPNLTGTVTATMSGHTGLPFLACGFSPTPFNALIPLGCPCLLLLGTNVDWQFIPTATRSCTIPCWNVLVGVQLKFQGADGLSTGPGCVPSQISFTDILSATIGG